MGSGLESTPRSPCEHVGRESGVFRCSKLKTSELNVHIVIGRAQGCTTWSLSVGKTPLIYILNVTGNLANSASVYYISAAWCCMHCTVFCKPHSSRILHRQSSQLQDSKTPLVTPVTSL